MFMKKTTGQPVCADERKQAGIVVQHIAGWHSRKCRYKQKQQKHQQ
jgi:hypothetical protein